jgi:hypothetical protein
LPARPLTGLVFVALSLNLGAVIPDPTHRYRAIGTLSNFAGIFVLCTFALMGSQNHVAVGIEWLLVSSVAGTCMCKAISVPAARAGVRRR